MYECECVSAPLLELCNYLGNTECVWAVLVLAAPRLKFDLFWRDPWCCLVLVLHWCNLVCVLIGVITTFYKYQPPHLPTSDCQPLMGAYSEQVSSWKRKMGPPGIWMLKLTLLLKCSIPHDIFLHKIKNFLVRISTHGWSLITNYTGQSGEGTSADQHQRQEQWRREAHHDR